MILAGIDEAGYGPILGPLAVGCCAMRFDSPADPPPDGWKILKRLLSAKRDATGKRLHVNDSKKVYSPAAGLAELERAILTLLAACHGPCAHLDAVLALAAPESVPLLAAHDWYRCGADERHPIEVDATTLAIASNVARVELATARAGVVHLHAHVVPESRLNQMFAATRNKAATSFSFVARHLDALLTRFSDQDLVIVCDRQGGREHYGPLLRQMFEAWSLEVLAESPARSDYRLSQGDRSATLIFAEKAESLSISVALASMLAKYLREATMHRFNAYWHTHDPTLKPTAGYWTDGLRFLADLQPTLDRLGIDRAVLTRAR